MELPTSFNPYLSFAKKNSGWIIIAVIAVGIAIYIYFKGKKAGKIYIPDVPYIADQAMWQATFNPNILADELYQVMDKVFPPVLTGTKDAVWKKLLALGTDNMIIAVYNTFNQRYKDKGKGSLTKWIDDELYFDLFSGIKTKTIAKLRSLNCK